MSVRDLVDLSAGEQLGRSHRLLRLSEVLRRNGLGRTATYALIARGEFPAPVKSGRASRWVEEEIDEWIRQLIRVRSGWQAHG
jgi:prophage regulatory protein